MNPTEYCHSGTFSFRLAQQDEKKMYPESDLVSQFKKTHRIPHKFSFASRTENFAE
jgi:hypothetical protein